MLSTISNAIRQHLQSFPREDSILLKGSSFALQPTHFQLIPTQRADRTIAFVDGGQGEILSGGNFSLHFIRIAGVVFKDNRKRKSIIHEFYVFTTAFSNGQDIIYSGKIFPVQGKALISENVLRISSRDPTIRVGTEMAPISVIATIARRFAELQLAAQLDAEAVILDGTLEPTFLNEETYLTPLGKKVSALAKTSTLFTRSGNNPMQLLQKYGPFSCWKYAVDSKTYFVKLHPQAKHIFRFEGDPDLLPELMRNSADALFLGYPYGLILADKIARVSNKEVSSLRMNFLLRKENEEIQQYLRSTNAHEILDNLG